MECARASVCAAEHDWDGGIGVNTARRRADDRADACPRRACAPALCVEDAEMAFGMFGNTAPPIGIEFGTHSLKALQIDPSGTPSVIAAGAIETPDKLVTDEVGRMAFQMENLAYLIKEGGFKGKRAICSLPAKQTIVQHLQVPKNDGAKLATAVQAQMQMQMGIEPRQAVIRHVEVGDFTRSGGAKTEVICFAVPRDIVFRQIEAMRRAKLEPVGIHSSQLAIARAFDRITRREEDHQLTTLFIDLGAGTTKVVITHGRDMAFAKTIDVAGRTFDEVCARQLDCSLLDARRKRLALATGAPLPQSPAPREEAGAGGMSGRRLAKDAEGGTTDLGGVAAAVDRRTGSPTPGVTPELSEASSSGLSSGSMDLSEPLEWLTDEVSMCLRYHHALFPERKVNRAIFLGGEARHLAMCQHIARTLRTPSQIADPLAHLPRKGREKAVNVDLTEAQPGWAVPFGLCFCPLEA